MSDLKKLAETLTRRGFRVSMAGTADEARSIVLGDVTADATVGIGGSVTIKELGLYETMRERGNTVYWHWEASSESAAETRSLAAAADVYLCSTNAITEAGELINIDGTGNRVASMFYGPMRNIIVIGKNKLSANYESAMRRIKEVACVKNAIRLGLDTPCARSGQCMDCAPGLRMCNVATIITNPPGRRDMHIVLVNEDLGY